MRKKNLSLPQIITVSVSVIIFAIIFVIVFFDMAVPLPKNYYIFQDIEECERLFPADLPNSNIMVEKYDTPTKDKGVKDLSYTAFFGMKYKSDTLKYEIFAYEFESSDAALQYFVNVTGKTSYKDRLPLDENDTNTLFSVTKGFSTRIVIVSQNRAYKVNVPNKYLNALTEKLWENFSQEIPLKNT